MRKTIRIGLLCAVLLAGCYRSDPAAEQLPEPEATPAPRMQSYTVPGLTYGDVAKKANEIEYALAEERWDDLAALFAAETDASSVKEQWFADGEETYAPAGAAPIFRDGCIGAVVYLSGSSGVREAVIRMNEALQIETMECLMRPPFSEPESSETWTEEWIYAGNEPKITGILTLPVNEDGEKEDLPPVAVLVGEETDDAMNESGSNSEFRKELAHGLAENGIASVRFNTRCYEDPRLCDVFGYDLDFILSEDIASIFHSLETYPVNARQIIYVGHGAAGTMGYSYVYHHFEVTGGLVLINAPFTKDGVSLFTRAAWLDASVSEQITEALEDGNAQQDTVIAGYPLSYWRDWNEMGALKYTRYVAIPILIQQGKEDRIVTEAEDYENWKSQKGSNVTMKVYPDTGHDLRDKDGTFESLYAEDIADWLNGVDITKKKPEETPLPSPSAVRRP